MCCSMRINTACNVFRKSFWLELLRLKHLRSITEWRAFHRIAHFCTDLGAGCGCASASAASCCLAINFLRCSRWIMMRYAPILSLRGPLSMERKSISLGMPSLSRIARASTSNGCSSDMSSVLVGAITKSPSSSSSYASSVHEMLFCFELDSTVLRSASIEPVFECSRGSMESRRTGAVWLPLLLPCSSDGPMRFLKELLNIDRDRFFRLFSVRSSGSSAHGETSMGCRKFSAKTLLARFVLNVSCVLTGDSAALVMTRLRENHIGFLACLAADLFETGASALSSVMRWWLIHWLERISLIVGRREGTWTRILSVRRRKEKIQFIFGLLFLHDKSMINGRQQKEYAEKSTKSYESVECTANSGLTED